VCVERRALMTVRSGQDEVVGDRTAADLGCGLAMLAYIRGRLCAWEGEDFRIPATALDEVLDELSSERLLPAAKRLQK
jgi:hypothetical protein